MIPQAGDNQVGYSGRRGFDFAPPNAVNLRC
jgi:hypothetical protein